MSTDFLFPSRIGGGSKAALAQSVPEPAAPLAPSGEFAAEFERLAGRPPTEAECEVARRAAGAQSVWAENLLPESLAHLSLALATTSNLRVLFVSPSADLLEHRRLRLAHRGPWASLSGLRSKLETPGAAVWCTPNQLDVAHLTRVFGTKGPDVVVVEDAHVMSTSAEAHRPSLAKLTDVLARFSKANAVLTGPASGRAETARALDDRTEDENVVVEELIGGPQGPVLRVSDDESEAIAAVVGPLPRPCVVLCSTPAQADQVYAHLEAEQVPVHRFHSGLPPSDRARELLQFALPGRRAVLVAVSSFGPQSGFAGQTNTSVPEDFGHGYARRDLRSMVHLCAPCSLDQYTRELALLGLAPPEGPRPIALMLYNPAHLTLNLALLQRKRPAVEALQMVVESLLRARKGQLVEVGELQLEGSISLRAIRLVVDFLEDLAVVEKVGTQVRVLVGVNELEQAAKRLETAFSALCSGDAPRLEGVEQYALADGCRAQALQRLLDQPVQEDKCGVCDCCDPQGLAALPEATSSQGLTAPTIETRAAKRRAPVRRSDDDDDDLDVEHDLDAAEA